mgnify:CR=1 FL=1
MDRRTFLTAVPAVWSAASLTRSGSLALALQEHDEQAVRAEAHLGGKLAHRERRVLALTMSDRIQEVLVRARVVEDVGAAVGCVHDEQFLECLTHMVNSYCDHDGSCL